MRAIIATTILLSFTLVPAGLASANAMAPWSPCNGLEEGDRCIQEPYYNGYCEIDTDCEDSEDTEENECLLCIDSNPTSCSLGSLNPTTWTLIGQVGIGLLGAFVCLRRAARRRSS